MHRHHGFVFLKGVLTHSQDGDYGGMDAAAFRLLEQSQGVHPDMHVRPRNVWEERGDARTRTSAAVFGMHVHCGCS